MAIADALLSGGIAEALYGVPSAIGAEARGRLDEGLLAVVDRFYKIIDRHA